MHEPFRSYSTKINTSACGTLSYSATFDGSPIDTNSAPMRYDSATRTFTVYSEDSQLLGSRTITVSAHLTDYPEVVSEEPDVST